MYCLMTAKHTFSALASDQNGAVVSVYHGVRILFSRWNSAFDSHEVHVSFPKWDPAFDSRRVHVGVVAHAAVGEF